MTKVSIELKSELWCVGICFEEALYGIEADVVNSLRTKAVTFNVRSKLGDLPVQRCHFVETRVPQWQEIVVDGRLTETLKSMRDSTVINLVFAVVCDVTVRPHVFEYQWPAVNARSI
jgi:hypothetical protein